MSKNLYRNNTAVEIEVCGGTVSTTYFEFIYRAYSQHEATNVKFTIKGHDFRICKV